MSIPDLTSYTFLLLPFLLAMFLAINMGGSGIAPAFSAAYGTKIIKKAYIPGIFGIMVFLGAIIAGSETTRTMGNDILQSDKMSFTIVSIIMLSVSISLFVANISGIPQSTSQATVLSVFAIALFNGNYDPEKLLLEILPMWLILPIISFVLSFLLGKYIYKPIRRRGLTISRSNKVNQKPILNIIIIVMSLYVAFSIGANNVANAAGPIASMTANELNISLLDDFALLSLLGILIVAPCFSIGSSVFGSKILKNTGQEIILFGKFEAVIIAFVSGSLLLYASVAKGIPTSLVQLGVASILGIGVAKLGIKNIFRKTNVRKFFYMWIIAPCISFSLSLLLISLADYANVK
jgi:sulfate permease